MILARRKTVTAQTIIGEQGIALISTRCLEMGFIFHPRRVDHGIDGHIDLVEPVSGALLNQTLLVQSKAQNRPFPSETDDNFRYLCDERDLDLWLSGNARSFSSSPTRSWARPGGSMSKRSSRMS
jgi:hypothetical protein